MTDPYERETLTRAVAESRNWADVMRRLGLKKSGGRHRVLRKRVAALGIDTSHFQQRSPFRTYTDEAIAAAVGTSSTLREVVTALGAPPATGTLSHIRRRIAAAGIDVSHFPGLNRPEGPRLLFTVEELRNAAASADSVRGAARLLGLADGDSRSRAALGAMLREHGIDTSHFRNARPAISEGALRAAVPGATSYADVMRALGLAVNDTNHRRVRRTVLQLQLDTGHFTRRPWGSTRVPERRPIAPRTLVVMPRGSARAKRPQLHRALQEVGVPYRCERCANPGSWLGRPITLQIDHINGDWLDNRRENLRYLCPNCHALTDTWCRNRRKQQLDA
ncbi:HNH endonuclease [Streptomyces sp. NBC_01267]|uniref:HNH endonuclease signature motif containing protein n=1 Tax=unclassified Streptomyces TaxID=2593676 RepID=UPI002DD9388F|nr:MULTISPECIES: HNH endonuclease signature motif containing protein [unclassified Streptomyces]WSC22274.1 HNH endonuclease [Streptomyces sp. NBC_01766]WSV56123.1 HNH endonuclease [Streptomyces sp. NBC_01014]